jgi:hypothetical protein
MKLVSMPETCVLAACETALVLHRRAGPGSDWCKVGGLNPNICDSCLLTQHFKRRSTTVRKRPVPWASRAHWAPLE